MNEKTKATSSEKSQGYVRKETFIARYPRKTKILFLFFTLFFLFLPFLGQNVFILSEKPLEPAKFNEQKETIFSHSQQKKDANSSNSVPSEEKQKANFITTEKAPLSSAPDPGLVEVTELGELPIIGKDGRKPWQVYSHPFDKNDKSPRVSIVIVGLGISQVVTDSVIRRLPSPITLAFESQSPTLGAWLTRARQDGHETLLSLPMEPLDFPKSDSGPNSLLTDLSQKDNLKRFLLSLKSGAGYIGITTTTGSGFVSNPEKISPILKETSKRGLLFLDLRLTPSSVTADLAKQFSVPTAVANLQIDKNPSPESISLMLNELESITKNSGKAVGFATPLPITISMLEKWIDTLPEKGIVLSPLSAVVE